jgi:hypothetical protein
MSWKRKAGGGFLTVTGFLLSPLSWWNDLVINIPLALGFAWGVSYFWHGAFEASLILGYWLTNVLGLVLMHKGAKLMLTSEVAYGWKALGRDAAIAMGYTLLIALLVWLKVLQPVTDYFPVRP